MWTYILIFAVVAVIAWFLWNPSGGKKLTEIQGITIEPSEEILKDVNESLLNAIKTTGNKLDHEVIYRGMSLGKAKGYADYAVDKKSYVLIWIPNGGTLKKQKDLILILPEDVVKFGMNAIMIDANANLYPIAENVFYAGEGLKKYVDFVNLKAIREMLGDMAQVQAKYYALRPAIAGEMEILQVLHELRQKKIREVI